MADQKPKFELIWGNKVPKDTHHILFFRRDWRKEMWSRKLREHPYMMVEVPSNTLHPQIHKIMDAGTPVPSEFACQVAYCDLEDLRMMELIDVKVDGIERRIDTIIEIFKYCGEDIDDTIRALLTQKYIVRKFYQGG